MSKTAQATPNPAVNRTDEELQSLVKRDLLKTRPELGRVLVWAHKGIVQLSGVVSSFYVRQLALATVSRNVEVVRLVDNIEVCIPGPRG